MESFFSSLKTERIRRKTYRTRMPSIHGTRSASVLRPDHDVEVLDDRARLDQQGTARLHNGHLRPLAADRSGQPALQFRRKGWRPVRQARNGCGQRRLPRGIGAPTIEERCRDAGGEVVEIGNQSIQVRSIVAEETILRAPVRGPVAAFQHLALCPDVVDQLLFLGIELVANLVGIGTRIVDQRDQHRHVARLDEAILP